MTEPATRDGLKPHIVYYVAMSLDGYVTTPHGGMEWLAPFEKAGEDYECARFYSSIDAVVLPAKHMSRLSHLVSGPMPENPAGFAHAGALEPAHRM